MSWFDAVLLGVLQGLTEFLPISSSAHLSIAGQLLGHNPGAAFTAVSQLGTEAAVILYFAKDIARIVSRWAQSLVGRVPRSDPDARMGWMVIIGTVPIVALGLLFQDAIDTALRNLWITVAMLAIFGVVLGVADRIGRGTRRLDQLTWGHGVLYGAAQALALVPGVSRSGATTAMGLFLGYTREQAARYSFLLAIPAVFGSGLYKLKDVASDPHPAWGQTIVATVLAFVVGLTVIHWLLRWISTHSFRPFVIYRIALAAFVAVLLVTGTISPT